MKTTLKAIRKFNPCTSGWKKLLEHLEKTKADDEPLSILEILKSNGLDDALWCLRAVEGHDREIRLFSVWCARQVQHLMTDQRSVAALDVAERYANGSATEGEFAAAGAAARAAVAAGTAWDAARAAAWTSARAASLVDGDAAWATARVTAQVAVAAWDAAQAAAWAAGGATQAAQEKELVRICELSSRGDQR